MTKSVFLHLGFHKTASTYIQRVIELNRNGVLHSFHVVNRSKHETSDLKIALSRYGKSNNSETRTAAVAECARIIEQFEAGGKDKLLLSEEVLLGHMLRQCGERGLYSTLEPRITLLIECLANYEIHFLFYTREQSAWLRSLYNQAVKQARFSKTFENFIAGVDTSDVWGILQRRVSAAAGDHEVHFFPLEEDANTPVGAGNRLFKYIGLSEEDLTKMIKPPRPANVSWPDPFLKLMRLLNISKLDDGSLAIVRKTLHEHRHLLESVDKKNS